MLEDTCGINKIGKQGACSIHGGTEQLLGVMEGAVKRTCINVFIRAWCIGKCSNLIDLGCVDPSVGIDCLPDGKQSIHIPVSVTFLVFQRRGRFIGWEGEKKRKKWPYA